MNTIDEVKAACRRNDPSIAGMQFTNQRGSVATVLANKSSRDKYHATMTCTIAGCTDTHLREMSDWHQCYKCLTHQGKKSNKGSGHGSIKSTEDKQAKLTEANARLKKYAANLGVKLPDAVEAQLSRGDEPVAVVEAAPE